MKSKVFKYFVYFVTLLFSDPFLDLGCVQLLCQRVWGGSLSQNTDTANPVEGAGVSDKMLTLMT